MKYRISSTLLLTAILMVTGCRRSNEAARLQKLDSFHASMMKIDSLVSDGMTRSNVLQLLGSPISHGTNSDDLVVDDYVFRPKVLGYGLITNGFIFVYSNAVLIRKQPIIGEQRVSGGH